MRESQGGIIGGNIWGMEVYSAYRSTEGILLFVLGGKNRSWVAGDFWVGLADYGSVLEYLLLYANYL